MTNTSQYGPTRKDDRRSGRINTNVQKRKVPGKATADEETTIWLDMWFSHATMGRGTDDKQGCLQEKWPRLGI